MDRSGILSAANRRLLEAYSQRTVASLRRAIPLPLALPGLEHLLRENVAKEVRKDSAVIASVAALVAARQLPGAAEVRSLLATTRAIDAGFLAQAGGTPIGIRIPYEKIDPIRYRRIERLLGAVMRIQEAWHGRRRLREVVRVSYCATEFECLIVDLLTGYAEETKILGESVHLPWLLQPVRQHIVDSLYRLMRTTAHGLAKEWSARL
jgi:hypothetical protein